MADRIKVRSPYIVDISGVVGDSTKVEIFLWNDPASVPVSPNYTLEKDIPTTAVGKAIYDISPYVRKFIAHSVYVDITTDTASPVGEYCYCNIKSYKNGILQTGGGSYTEELICFDGYGYFVDGQNPSQSNYLMTEGTYLIGDTADFGGIYYCTEGTAGTHSVLYTGLSSGSTVNFNITNAVGYLPYVYTPLTANESIKLEFKLGGVTQATYIFKPVCEPKYTTINCDFVNKYGAWQRLVFFKVSQDSMEMNNTEYNLMSDDTDYSLTENRRKVFNVNGNESIKCNTGFVPETYKEVIRQLMLSETIRIDDQPVILKTKSVDLQKSINTNNINYEIEFAYANPTINYIV